MTRLIALGVDGRRSEFPKHPGVAGVRITRVASRPSTETPGTLNVSFCVHFGEPGDLGYHHETHVLERVHEFEVTA